MQGSEWLDRCQVPVVLTDYTKASVLAGLNRIRAVALVSFVQPPDELYVSIHTAMLDACRESATCKRFIPSEFAGNIDDFPMLPSFYGSSRQPFRQILRESQGVEWTLVNNGWLMDYFLPKDRTYMPAIPDEFPVDPNGFRALIRGTGDEMQSWTCARDVAKAIVELLRAPAWVTERSESRHIVYELTRTGPRGLCRWRVEYLQKCSFGNGATLR